MTPKQEAALRLALDCVSTLANARDWVGCTPNERWDEDEMYAELCNATICLKKSLSIIQEALAEQPAQQALDKMAENARELGIQMQPEEPRAWFTVDELNAWADKKLKENPQWAEQPAQQEPFCYHDGHDIVGKEFADHSDVFPLYTSPQPSKPWVGLTTADLDEIDAPIRERGSATIAEIYRAIEAKLREKNAPQQSKEDA